MTDVEIYRYTLESIQHYINSMLADDEYNPPLSLHKHLMEIKALCDDILKVDEETEPIVDQAQVIISCDASIKKNPGGPASCAIVVRYPGMQPYHMPKALPMSTTINQAEYDAVYEAYAYLNSSLFTLRPGAYVEIRTDSMLVYKQISGLQECYDLQLKRRRDIILELAQNLIKEKNLKIKIVWYARCSTPDLKTANNLAQDILGIKNH